MPRKKQETREEKLRREIGNLARALEHESKLRSVRNKKAELERLLETMPAKQRLALVPSEEIEREREDMIRTCDELLASTTKRIDEKRKNFEQSLENDKKVITYLRSWRAKQVRQTPQSG